MSGIKVYNVGLKGITLSKGITVEEFKSWIVGTISGGNSDYITSVVESDDGGYVATGYQQSDSLGAYDIAILKYDNNLNLLSQKSLGGSNNDFGLKICKSSDGGFFVVGQQNSQVEGTSSNGFIVKYDSNLSLVTQRALGGSGTDIFKSVLATPDGGCIVVGSQTSQTEGGYDAFIVKYDSNLDVQSQKSIGGSASDHFEDVIDSGDGGYIAVGYHASNSIASDDGLIVKFNSNLEPIIVKGFGWTGADRFRSIVKKNDGGFVVCGEQNSQGQGAFDGMVVEYDSSLNVTKQIYVGGSDNDFFNSITKSIDGGYIVSGYSYSNAVGVNDILFVKLDSQLNVIGQKFLGGASNDITRSIITTSDLGYVTVGNERSVNGNYDGLIAKIPNDFSLLTGTLTSHSTLYWAASNLLFAPTTLNETTPTLTETTLTLTENSTTLVESTTSLSEIRSEKQ